MAEDEVVEWKDGVDCFVDFLVAGDVYLILAESTMVDLLWVPFVVFAHCKKRFPSIVASSNSKPVRTHLPSLLL
jgi:hypothetical protein